MTHGDAAVRVLTPGFIQHLSALNQAARWLREHGYAPVSIHLQGELPTMHLDDQTARQAARLLITEAKGYNSRRVDDRYRLCSVIAKGCLITWFEPL